jgi:hypothetical protein
MVKWHYVKDVKKEEAEVLCENLMKKSPHLKYGIGIARSNNPGMVGIYYREKDPK